MKLNRLIEQCVCGNNQEFSEEIKNNIRVLECNNCGIIHQLLENWNEEKYYNFYKLDYHTKFQKLKKVITYRERYDHDRAVSKLRLSAYMEFIKPKMIGLDIGSSNSAFVHTANELGFNCVGLEPGYDIGDDNVTIRGVINTANLESDHYDFVTMHDSIEHMVDVNEALGIVKRIIKSNGMLIIDLPDYFIKEGKHHWKYIEHLWFFTKEQFVTLLTRFGFSVEKVTEPIPGKLAFYARKI